MKIVFQDEERFNDDPDAFIFKRYGKSHWYIKILKKPEWKQRVIRSLKTSYKEEAIKQAKIKYQELIGTNQVLKNCLFNSEDIKIATLRKGLGRLCEDKFKNLMMVKGYQVSKDGKLWDRVQVKSTSQTDKMDFHLVTNHRDKIHYKQIVDYMTFISIMDDKVWMIPVENIPDKTGLSLTELKRDYEKFIVDYV